MEIALFGGSFDPPHIGHLLAATYVLATEPVDELWFVPVFAHPLGKRPRGSFDDRVALCERAVADAGLRRASVSRIEAELGGEGRTVDLLEHLRRVRPGDRFALVLGSDLAAERPQWKRFERILELARIIQLRRGGFAAVPGALRSGPDAAAQTLEPTPAEVVLPRVSSSEVRQLLAAGQDAAHLVPRGVLSAIRAGGLYGPGPAGPAAP